MTLLTPSLYLGARPAISECKRQCRPVRRVPPGVGNRGNAIESLACDGHPLRWPLSFLAPISPSLCVICFSEQGSESNLAPLCESVSEAFQSVRRLLRFPAREEWRPVVQGENRTAPMIKYININGLTRIHGRVKVKYIVKRKAAIYQGFMYPTPCAGMQLALN